MADRWEMGNRTPATCHPEFPVASHGLCRDCARRKWRADNPEKTRRMRRDNQLRWDYGISLADYEAILVSQGGVCKICGRSPGEKSLHVDHDHHTGKVRAILCGPCNKGIGLLGESPERVLTAYEYLVEHVNYSTAESI